MIYFFTPYSLDKRMFDAWDDYMDLIRDPEDWVCMMDGDIAFLNSDFGHHMQKYIDKYPDTGIFTSYASRSRTTWVMPEKHIFDSTNIIEHKKKANEHHQKYHLDVVEIDKRVTGHLMMMKKATWLRIRGFLLNSTENLSILSVDSHISKSVLALGLKIRLMKGIYVLHYYRHLEGADSKKHLTE